MSECTFEGVVVDRAVKLFLHPVSLDPLCKSGGELKRLAGANVEIDFHVAHLDVFKESVDGGYCRLFHGEPERVDTLSEHIERDAVGFGGVSGDNVLTGKPFIIVACAANIGILSGEGVGGFQSGNVLAAVHGLHGETFIGSPNQLFLERHALEVGIDFRFPLVVGDGGKLGEQFFFIVCHKLNGLH